MNLNISKIEKKLNIKIKEKKLLAEAFTHKSVNQNLNNEKLEFLGDRVIALILSKKLFDLYPHETEGVLDKRFAILVNRKTCASLAWQNGIHEFIIMADKKNRVTQKDEKILCDTLEALIGAIFVDKGYNYTKQCVLKLWKKNIEKSNITILDSKTKLQEYSLKLYKKLPVYNVVDSKGPKHNPTFKISVTIKNTKKFIGIGNSKKEAEQQAAKNLLKNINLI